MLRLALPLLSPPQQYAKFSKSPMIKKLRKKATTVL
jgi:hypothetical protein